MEINDDKIFIKVVMWRLKAPEKKPLVRRGDPDEKQRPIRRASQKKVNPNIEMSKYEQNI